MCLYGSSFFVSMYKFRNPTRTGLSDSHYKFLLSFGFRSWNGNIELRTKLRERILVKDLLTLVRRGEVLSARRSSISWIGTVQSVLGEKSAVVLVHSAGSDSGTFRQFHPGSVFGFRLSFHRWRGPFQVSSHVSAYWCLCRSWLRLVNWCWHLWDRRFRAECDRGRWGFKRSRRLASLQSCRIVILRVLLRTLTLLLLLLLRPGRLDQLRRNRGRYRGCHWPPTLWHRLMQLWRSESSTGTNRRGWGRYRALSRRASDRRRWLRWRTWRGTALVRGKLTDSTGLCLYRSLFNEIVVLVFWRWRPSYALESRLSTPLPRFLLFEHT